MYTVLNIIKIIKLGQMGWAGFVASMNDGTHTTT
jgi:hypothetical protein